MSIGYHFIVTLAVPDYLKQGSPDIVVRNYILRALSNYAKTDPQNAFERDTGPSNISAVLLPLVSEELDDMFPARTINGVITVNREDIIEVIKVRKIMLKVGALK